MKIGLALSGGGARGLAHLKVLQAFDEPGLKPDIIAGASMGAVIGAIYASGLLATEVQKFFQGINFIRYAQLFDISFKGDGLVKGSKFESVFSKLIETKNFQDLKIPLKVVATNLYKKQQQIFTKGDIVQAVRASISIPGVFEPVNINQELFVDGGLTNLIPSDTIRKDCDVLIAVDVSKETIKKETKTNFINILSSSFSLIQEKYAYEKSKDNPADYLININLENYSMFDFQKHNEIFKKADKYRLKTKKILKEILRR